MPKIRDVVVLGAVALGIGAVVLTRGPSADDGLRDPSRPDLTTLGTGTPSAAAPDPAPQPAPPLIEPVPGPASPAADPMVGTATTQDPPPKPAVTLPPGESTIAQPRAPEDGLAPTTAINGRPAAEPSGSVVDRDRDGTAGGAPDPAPDPARPAAPALAPTGPTVIGGTGTVTVASAAPPSSGAAAAPPASGDATCALWTAFKDRFVTSDGRVLDTANENISHSEGQGYGMILAVAHDDPAAFTRLWDWTYANLLIRPDGLLVWKWTPHGESRYPDTNSASDGDILVAYALLLAGERFNNPAFTELGLELVAAVQRDLIVEVGGYTVLLPGPEGFRRDDGSIIVNPSYWVFPALDLFSDLPDGAIWRTVIADGLRVLEEARFSRWNLNPDWAILTPEGRFELPDPDTFPPVFGYNAVRIPLYLRWGNMVPEAEPIAVYRRFWDETSDEGSMPIVVDLAAEQVDARGGNSGFLATRTLTQAAPDTCLTITFGEQAHYYDAVLVLLARLAQGDSSCACAGNL